MRAALQTQRETYLAHPVPTLAERKVDLRELGRFVREDPTFRAGVDPELAGGVDREKREGLGLAETAVLHRLAGLQVEVAHLLGVPAPIIQTGMGWVATRSRVVATPKRPWPWSRPAPRPAPMGWRATPPVRRMASSRCTPRTLVA